MPGSRISLILFCYRQERFAAEAVRSVLAQEGPAIEILLSDDCSPDATYEILEREASGYRGPHTVRLNRNRENLGSVAHLNRVMELVQGDFVVMAHGDDVSLPHRARCLAEVWREHGRSLITSDATMVDATLHVTGCLSDQHVSGEIDFDTLIVSSSRRTLVGATMAFGREIFSRFGPIDLELLPFGPSDQLLPLRAGFLKGVWYVDEPLILYRAHDSNMRDRIFNKLQGPLAAEESFYTELLAVKLCMLEEIMTQRWRGETDETQDDRQRRLQVAILKQLPLWVRARNKLLRRGGRQIWVDRRQFEATPLQPGLRRGAKETPAPS